MSVVQNPIQFTHSLVCKDCVFKRNSNKRNPSYTLALAKQKAVGSLEMFELYNSTLIVLSLYNPSFETFSLWFHESRCCRIPWSLAILTKSFLTTVHVTEGLTT